MFKRSGYLGSLMLLFFVFVFMTVYSHGLIMDNGVAGGYCTPSPNNNCKTGSSMEKAQSDPSGNTIERMVEKVSAAILEANGDYMYVLRKVEASNNEGLDSAEIIRLLDSASFKLKTALYYFRSLLAEAESTPYNSSFTWRLVHFDYDGFMKKHSLNPFIFQEVVSFLANGNLTGMLYYRQWKCLSLYNSVLKLRKEFYTTNTLNLSAFWTLNEKFAEYNLFGQYSCRVFFAI